MSRPPIVVPPFWQRALLSLGAGFLIRAGDLLPPLLRGLASQFEEVSDLVADQRGYAKLFNLDESPHPGWVGQFDGVPYDPSMTREQQIARVRSRGRTRGTPGALVAGVQATLTGDRVVQLDERDTSAYHVTVRTIITETPDVAAARAAARAAKPLGLVMAFGWLLRPTEVAGWSETVTQRVLACPLPSSTLYPSGALLPC